MPARSVRLGTRLGGGEDGEHAGRRHVDAADGAVLEGMAAQRLGGGGHVPARDPEDERLDRRQRGGELGQQRRGRLGVDEQDPAVVLWRERAVDGQDGAGRMTGKPTRGHKGRGGSVHLPVIGTACRRLSLQVSARSNL